MTRPTTRILITEPPPSGLGYCCMWVFFRRFGRTSLIAARLGIAKRTIQVYAAGCRDGTFVCEGKPNCMKKRL